MFFRRTKKDGVDPRERSLWSGLLSLGLLFPIAIVLGYYLGQWIGGMFGNPKIGALVGLVWGVLTGFWELYKLTKRLEKYDKLTNFSDTDNIECGEDKSMGGSDDSTS